MENNIHSNVNGLDIEKGGGAQDWLVMVKVLILSSELELIVKEGMFVKSLESNNSEFIVISD
jgi:hypothetical protein